VRVYLDKPGGIGMDDISQATRRISAMLDEAEVVPGRYTLEVSSPGVDRPLRDLDDVAEYEGEKAQVMLTAAVAGRKRFTGTIARVTGDAFVLDVDRVEFGAPGSADIAARNLARLIRSARKWRKRWNLDIDEFTDLAPRAGAPAPVRKGARP
jgi:ribosome maturation factor RimP